MESLDFLVHKEPLASLANLESKALLACLGTPGHQEEQETKAHQVLMEKMEWTASLALLDLKGIEANLGKMVFLGCQGLLVKKVHLETQGLLAHQGIKDLRESRVTL